MKSNVDELSRLEKKECFFESRRCEPGRGGKNNTNQRNPSSTIIIMVAEDHGVGERREDVLDGEWKRNRVAGRARRRPADRLSSQTSKVREHWLVYLFFVIPFLAFTNPSRRVAVAFELSQVLDTGLDRETLSILIALCENGVNPEALALVVKELKRESQDFRAQEYVS